MNSIMMKVILFLAFYFFHCSHGYLCYAEPDFDHYINGCCDAHRDGVPEYILGKWYFSVQIIFIITSYFRSLEWMQGCWKNRGYQIVHDQKSIWGRWFRRVGSLLLWFHSYTLLEKSLNSSVIKYFPCMHLFKV